MSTFHFVRASGCCRPDSPLGGGLLRFATVPIKCIQVYQVDREQVSGRLNPQSLGARAHPSSDASVILAACLARLRVLALPALVFITRHDVISGHKLLLQHRIAQIDLRCLFWFSPLWGPELFFCVHDAHPVKVNLAVEKATSLGDLRLV